MAQLDELQTTLEQLGAQQGQQSDIQTALDEMQTSIQETKTSLTNLSNQLNTLEQSTSTDIAELEQLLKTLRG